MAKLLERMLPTTTLDTIPSASESKAVWAAYRADAGRASVTALLTSPADNVKLAKSMTGENGTFNYSLSLAPASESGVNVCPSSTPECRKHCVAHAGNGGYRSVQEGRKLKTLFLRDHPLAFLGLLHAEILRAKRLNPGVNIGVRLNTFSDLPWHTIAPWLFTAHADVQFYDYTKVWNRTETAPVNWHLTLSATERTTIDTVIDATSKGHNVAVVFMVNKANPLPESFGPVPVVDGDKTDARYTDPVGVVVGLKAKGTMRRGSRFILAA